MDFESEEITALDDLSIDDLLLSFKNQKCTVF